MSKTSEKRSYTRLLLLPVPVVILAVSILVAAQGFAHRHPYFIPDYAASDLTLPLAQPGLTEEDYQEFFLQTGLGKPAVDRLMALGDAGILQILDTQQTFFQPAHFVCNNLGIVTREDHLTDGQGNLIYGFPMVPLENGDVLLSFSTHTMGWRHGHAGLVVDASEGKTLEAVLIGTDSKVVSASHWQVYSTFIHLRLRDITPEQQDKITRYALEYLDGIPYRLSSGVLGAEKFPEEASGAQCAYLVWYALMQAGYDVDSDGGRIVTVADLANSPLFEVVQIYGVDPREFIEQ